MQFSDGFQELGVLSPSAAAQHSNTEQTDVISQSRERKCIFIWAAGARPPKMAQLSGDRQKQRWICT